MNISGNNMPPVTASLRTGGLPLQNQLLAAAIIGVASAAALFLNTETGLPLGRVRSTEAFGSGGVVGLFAGLVTANAVALLTARGVAKLLLLPRRRRSSYGYWLLAANALLATLPLAGLDLLATRVLRWWHWENAAWHWQGIALPNVAGWLLVNVIALLLATPALIDKRPVQPPPGLRPLAVWFALNAAGAVGCLARASDAAVALLAAPTLVVTMLAFQAHRRAVPDCSPPPEEK